MECVYWCQESVCPAEKSVEKDFKKDRAAKRVFEDRLEDLNSTNYEQAMNQGWIKPITGSKNKLQEWIIDLPRGTARMFFVLHENCLYFLHFFIKKSSSRIKTPAKEIELAESRAKLFWDYIKRSELKEIK
jgi:phage-related protein